MKHFLSISVIISILFSCNQKKGEEQVTNDIPNIEIVHTEPIKKIKKQVDEDSLRNPYHNAFMTDISLDDVGILILNDSIQPMDNNVTFKLLDTISTCPLEALPFFLSVYDTIIAQADGALAEIMGLYSWKFVKQRPNEFLDHISNNDSSIIDDWANHIVYEMYFAFTKDSLEYYCIKFVEGLKDGNVSDGLSRFEKTMISSAKSIIED